MINSGNYPLVTIITVAKNSELYIRDTIESVLNQDYANLEYIIIDGASTDDTLKIIKEYEPKFKGKMWWVSEADSGIYNAINKGIKLAGGDIIGIINSDDYYERNIIKSVVDSIKGYDMVHGRMRFINSYGKTIKVYKHKKGILRKYLSTPFNHPTMFVQKKVYERIGSYNENYTVAADYDFMLRFCRKNLHDNYIDQVISNLRTVGITSSATLVVKPDEIKEILHHNGLPWSIAYVFVAIREIKAHMYIRLSKYPWIISYIRKYIKYHSDCNVF